MFTASLLFRYYMISFLGGGDISPVESMERMMNVQTHQQRRLCYNKAPCLYKDGLLPLILWCYTFRRRASSCSKIIRLQINSMGGKIGRTKQYGYPLDYDTWRNNIWTSFGSRHVEQYPILITNQLSWLSCKTFTYSRRYAMARWCFIGWTYWFISIVFKSRAIKCYLPYIYSCIFMYTSLIRNDQVIRP